MKRLLNLILIIMLIFNLVGCTNSNNEINNDKPSTENVSADESAYPFTFTDDEGVEVTINEKPQRVVSGAPTITETVYALGMEDVLVGVTDDCNYPPVVASKPKIGLYYVPDVEKILDKEPDVLIIDYLDEDVRRQLDDAGVTVACIYPSNYSAVTERIKLIGQILDANESAKKLTDDMDKRTNEILEKVKGQQPKRVFFESWNDPLMTAGPGSFVDEMINMLGSENIAADVESRYVQYSVESLIEKNPEIYLSADDGFKTIDDIKNRTGYDEIDAVKNEKIFLLDNDIISRPGPRIVDALELMAEAIYGEK